MLGRLPDEEVAKIVKRSVDVVKKARQRFGIPPLHQGGLKQNIRESVLAAVSVRDVVPFWLIRTHVLADWGKVSERTIYRELRKLQAAGVIERKHKPHSCEGGYVLADGPDAYEDVQCRCGHGAMWHADGVGYCEKCGCLHLEVK